MRLLADENVPLDSVRALRSAGHDVFSASEVVPGEPDTTHLDRSIREDRLIVTFDRDFGELVTRGAQRPPAGVLLVRIVPKSALEVTELLLARLAPSARPQLTRKPFGGRGLTLCRLPYGLYSRCAMHPTIAR